MVRNPRDTLVSGYRYYSMIELIGPYLGSWGQFFQLFKEKQLIWGDLFEHTVEWYNFNKTRENSLILRYEDDLKDDLRGSIKKLSDFLGKNLSENAIDIIAKRTTFENQSKDEMLNMSQKFLPFLRKKFMWRGQIGNWKEWFNQEQLDYVDGKCKKNFDPIGLKFKYE